MRYTHAREKASACVMSAQAHSYDPGCQPNPSLVGPAAAADAQALGGQRLPFFPLSHRHALIGSRRAGGGGLLAPVAQAAWHGRAAWARCACCLRPRSAHQMVRR